MLALDVALGFLASAVVLALALALLPATVRRSPDRLLPAFLLLVAAGLAADTWAALAADELGTRLQLTLFALDAPVLYAFVRRLEPAGPPAGAVGAAGATTALLFAWVPRAPGSDAEEALRALVLVVSSLVYLLAWGLALRAFVARPSERRSWALYAALSFAALPALHRIGGWSIRAGDFVLPGLVAYDPILVLPPLAALGVAITLLLRRRVADPAARRFGVGVAWAGLGMALATHGAILAADHDAAAATLAAIALPARWLLAGAFLSSAVVRHAVLDVPRPARRRVARVVLGASAVVVALVALAAARSTLGADALGLSPTEAGLLLVVVVVSQSFRRLLDRVAAALYGLPPPGDPAAAQAAYRAAASRAVAAGRAPAEDLELARLREELEIDPRTAEHLATAAEAASDAPLVPGRLVAGRWRVERLVGRGASSRVFLARDERLGRAVALKEIAADEGDAAAREARRAGSLAHPNVVAVHDVVGRPGAALLVTEALAGSLEERLAARGPLDVEAGLRLADGVLAGLAAVHAAGLVHRDLKPANVLLAEDGTPKIADFGVAASRHGTTIRPGEIVGTPGFLAPEQRRGEPATTASDVYAVSVLLRRAIAAPLPAALDAVLARAAAEDPGARPAAGEMRGLLAACRAEAR